METKKPQNPTAFPFGYGTDKYERSENGMDLRDYFAAKAMQAVIMHHGQQAGSKDALSEIAYDIADAMLKKREL